MNKAVIKTEKTTLNTLYNTGHKQCRMVQLASDKVS